VKAWKKTSPELVAAFDHALPTTPSVTRRPMFGYASAFVNGNMFAGTFRETIVVRLAADDRVALLKLKGAAPFEPMKGRPMKEYVVVPASIVATPKALGSWIERGHQYALGLPAKGTVKRAAAATQVAKRTPRKQATPRKAAMKKAVAKKRTTKKR
jgi:TfoX/Sxy family transcriptional regulator of competence genes